MKMTRKLKSKCKNIHNSRAHQTLIIARANQIRISLCSQTFTSKHCTSRLQFPELHKAV